MSKKKNTPTPPQAFDFKKVKLFVATPAYGGQMSGFYVRSLLNLQILAMQQGMELAISFLMNESLITRGRNNLAHQFMHVHTHFTHFMFIDADICFDPGQLLQMIAADVDVITGIYPKKEINWHSVTEAVKRGVAPNDLRHHTGNFVLNLKGYKAQETVRTDKPCEIWNGGTGFMLIKRKALAKMAKSKLVKTYTNDVGDSSGNNSLIGKPFTQFFTESIEKGTNRLLSEDYHFCQTWRKMGGKIYAAPWVQLAHVGTYIFEGKFLTMMPEEAAKMMKGQK